MSEKWTDEDPDAATKLPTGEVVERTDPQEAAGLAEDSAPTPDRAAYFRELLAVSLV